MGIGVLQRNAPHWNNNINKLGGWMDEFFFLNPTHCSPFLGTNDWDVLSRCDQSRNAHSRRILQVQLLADSQRHRPSVSAHHEDSEVVQADRETRGEGQQTRQLSQTQAVQWCRLNLWWFLFCGFKSHRLSVPVLCCWIKRAACLMFQSLLLC